MSVVPSRPFIVIRIGGVQQFGVGGDPRPRQHFLGEVRRQGRRAEQPPRQLHAADQHLLVALVGADTDSKVLLDQFPAYDGIAPTAAGRLYLIDPLGNLVLSYSAAAPDKALLTDLKKLLRLSHIG